MNLRKAGVGLLAASAMATGVIVSTATQAQARDTWFGYCKPEGSKAFVFVDRQKNYNNSWTYRWQVGNGYLVRAYAPDPYYKKVYVYNSYGHRFFGWYGSQVYGGVVRQPSWGGLFNKSVYGVHISQVRCSFVPNTYINL